MKHNGQIIFVVDDSEWHNFILEKMLLMRGYIVRTFTDGIKLLEQLKTDKPHLIISDINMPNLNGYQLFEEVKKIPEASDIPLIYVSSQETGQVKREILENGAAGFIRKPVIEKDLLEAVAKIVVV